MLELARDRSAGAQTYHVNVAHTAQAREILGPDAFLGVEHPVLLKRDPGKARAAAREHLHPYLNTPNNIAKFRRLGYAEEEIATEPGGSAMPQWRTLGEPLLPRPTRTAPSE